MKSRPMVQNKRDDVDVIRGRTLTLTVFMLEEKATLEETENGPWKPLKTCTTSLVPLDSCWSCRVEELYPHANG